MHCSLLASEVENFAQRQEANILNLAASLKPSRGRKKPPCTKEVLLSKLRRSRIQNTFYPLHVLCKLSAFLICETQCGILCLWPLPNDLFIEHSYWFVCTMFAGRLDEVSDLLSIRLWAELKLMSRQANVTPNFAVRFLIAFPIAVKKTTTPGVCV